MRVLLINEYVSMGGAEVQTKRECELFRSKGDEVILMTFDPAYPECDTKDWVNYPIIIKQRFNRWKDKLFGNSVIKKKLQNKIAEINPDYIHINGVFGFPLDVMDAVKHYKTVQTVRDYGAVCPCGTCIKKNYNECKGYKIEKCSTCGRISLKNVYDYLSLCALNRRRKECLDVVLTPSAALARKCNENGINAKCVNNPFDFEKICNKPKQLDNNPKLYLYYGLIAENKGIRQLIQAFEVFQKNHNAKLLMAGKVYGAFSDEFEILQKRESINYLGELKYSQIMELYPQVYCVVVPSLWIENYPNTVLEALANKTIVIGSNRGGIPEMIGDERFLFNIQDEKALIDKLIFSYELSEIEYQQITEQKYNEVILKNSLDDYYEKLTKIYSEITE